MKQWRSKYGRITKAEIDKYIAEYGWGDIYCYFLVEDMLCTVRNNKIYWELIDNENMYLAITNFLLKEKINIFNSIEEFKKQLDIKD